MPSRDRGTPSSSTKTLGSASKKGAPEPPPPPKKGGFFCCCNVDVEDVRRGVEMTAANLRAPPPLSLQPGHANEEGHRRGMAAPRQGWLEVVNKNKSSEIIGVLVASNAVDLALKGHDVNGYLTSHLCVFPADTVFNATFGSDLEKLQIALFYGAKYKNLDKMREGDVHDNFEFVKGYSVDCYQRNVLLKYKAGALEIQRGQGETLLSTKKRSIGGGIDMKTNVAALELVAEG